MHARLLRRKDSAGRSIRTCRRRPSLGRASVGYASMLETTRYLERDASRTSCLCDVPARICADLPHLRTVLARTAHIRTLRVPLTVGYLARACLCSVMRSVLINVHCCHYVCVVSSSPTHSSAPAARRWLALCSELASIKQKRAIIPQNSDAKTTYDVDILSCRALLHP